MHAQFAARNRDHCLDSSRSGATGHTWNKGKLVGQETPFKLKEIWAIRVRLRIASRCRRPLSAKRRS